MEARFVLAGPPYDVPTEAALARMMPKSSGIPPIQLFRLLAREPSLNEAMEPLGQYLLAMGTHAESSLTRRDREIVVLRTCARCGCEYEWGIHARVHARMAGLSAEEIRATAIITANHATWSERDQLSLDLVDELSGTNAVSKALWGRLQGHWKQSDLLLLITLTGWYHLVSFIANTAQLEPEPWAARFPTQGRDASSHETQGVGA